MTRLSKAALKRAVDHLIRYGDTDVLPHPIEVVFLSEKRTPIVEELSKLDLDAFNPTQALETIAPKSKLGFRIIHQLPLVETILFTERWLHNFGRCDEWNLCLIARTVVRANQERR